MHDLMHATRQRLSRLQHPAHTAQGSERGLSDHEREAEFQYDAPDDDDAADMPGGGLTALVDAIGPSQASQASQLSQHPHNKPE